jgi:phenylalanyl-tRNA synthetase beta chain
LLAGDVVAAVEALDEPLLERVSVFDEYEGEDMEAGERALAFSIVYRSPDRTLTEDEVGALHDKVVSSIVGALGVRVRA